MMTRLIGFFRHNNGTQTTLVTLLCLSLLVLLLMQVARGVNPSILGNLREIRYYQYYQDPDVLLIGSWQFASAHSNVQFLQSQRLRLIDIRDNGLLLVARDTTSSLALILPLLALFTALALSRAKPTQDVSRSVRHWILGMGLLSLTITIIVGLFLVIESRILEIPYSWSQWSRALVWLGIVGTYFATFLFLGRWISQCTRHIRTAAWILLSLFVALFMIQSSRELLMRFDGSHLPPVPDLPVEVRLSLFRPSGEPRVTPDREEMVANYLESVDAYSQSVHAVVAGRYRLERWWHVISPQLLLNEISSQLLQARLPDVVDVIVASRSKEPSLMASLMSVAPEIAWLAILCCIAGLGTWRITARKREIAS
jgi:hypothetical protein